MAGVWICEEDEEDGVRRDEFIMMMMMMASSSSSASTLFFVFVEEVENVEVWLNYYKEELFVDIIIVFNFRV